MRRADVLFPRDILAGIARGEIRLAFRCWRRPTVRTGGRLRTPVGELAIHGLRAIDPADITDDDARAAGRPDRAAVIRALSRAAPGQTYRIEFELVGPDTRALLREVPPTVAEVADILRRLTEMDRRRGEPWVRPLLASIAAGPGVRAADLAAEAGRPLLPFKADVRRLKDLGLTESLEVGYRLSPRGRALLEAWPKP